VKNRAPGSAGIVAASIFFFPAGTLTVPAAHAHHSAARFDSSRTVTVKGVVTRYEWSNPHVYIYFEQLTDTGAQIKWRVEAFPISTMRRFGWSKSTLHAGDSITVTGKPAKDANDKSLFPTLIKRGDTTLFSER
jgi:hypothetical protein